MAAMASLAERAAVRASFPSLQSCGDVSAKAGQRCGMLLSAGGSERQRGLDGKKAEGSFVGLLSKGRNDVNRKQLRRRLSCSRAALEEDQVGTESKKILDEAVETVKSTAAETAKQVENGTEKAKDLLLNAAQQLREQADALRSQASIATEQLVETAGKHAGFTAEQLKEETEKTAAQLKAEAEKAAEELKEHSERAAAQLAATAHETAEIAKESLVVIVENSPESIKEIAEVAIHAHSKEAAKNGAVIHDFCLGIPYGALLTVGGLFWFLVSGSLNALRFGTILGGILLASSIQSLRVWQKAKSTMAYIITQAVVAAIVLIKEASKFTETGAMFPTGVTAVVSAAMVAFYAYVVLAGGPPKKKVETTTSLAS